MNLKLKAEYQNTHLHFPQTGVRIETLTMTQEDMNFYYEQGHTYLFDVVEETNEDGIVTTKKRVQVNL
jgi:hypothetical protein